MLKERLLDFVNRAVPNPEHLGDLERDLIVDHLMSDKVMVKSLTDLVILSEDMLPSWVGLIPRKLIIQAAKSGADGNTQHSNTANQNLQPGTSYQSSTFSSRANCSTSEGMTNTGSARRRSLPDYNFSVPWASLPQNLLNEMKEAHLNKKAAESGTVKKFRDAIAVKLREDYNSYRERTPSAFKVPGVEVYEKIAEEVIQRYKFAIQETLNGIVFSDGKANFIRKLEIHMENKARTHPQERATAALVKQAKGVPGIIANEYAPPLTKIMLTKQRLLKQRLLSKFEEGADYWNLSEIEKMMEGSYELQRQDIIRCREAVMERRDSDSDAEEAATDNPEEKAMQVVLKEWPFLFQASHINSHNKRLSGLDLQERLCSFCNRKPLQYLSLFLTSCSKTNTENLTLKLNLESEMEHISNSSLFTLSFIMLANHFGEAHTSFLFEIEKPMDPDKLRQLSLPNHPTIVSTGDFYSDEGFQVMIDSVCVAQTKGALDAFVILFNSFFVFDLEYPSSLRLTFEFLERIVLEMAVVNTRVKNVRGKVVLVLSKQVRDLGDAFQKFCDYMDRHLK